MIVSTSQYKQIVAFGFASLFAFTPSESYTGFNILLSDEWIDQKLALQTD